MIRGRLAGAPISWGVCEVPDWGHQMGPERVLVEMGEIGLAATELGPPGFLPSDPRDCAALLAECGLVSVGAFVAVTLHDADRDAGAAVLQALDACVATGADTLVLAAAAGGCCYDERVELDDGAWRRLCTNLDRIGAQAAQRGVRATLHPHAGTAVERAEDVDRVLSGSSISLCLDTGHLLIGGTDPVELADRAPERIGHCHLKDVDAGLAERVRSGELGYAQAVREGLYPPLGTGDADIAAVVRRLEASGFGGWYVMEQDRTITAEPEPGSGPAVEVRRSLDYVMALTP